MAFQVEQTNGKAEGLSEMHLRTLCATKEKSPFVWAEIGVQQCRRAMPAGSSTQLSRSLSFEPLNDYRVD
jgi:hypothetical protein